MAEDSTRAGATSCPCCGGETDVVASYTREVVVAELARMVGNAGVVQCAFPDYAMRRCRRCELEFADPMQEPGEGFYGWLTSSGVAYPTARWEWARCVQLFERTYRHLTGARARVVDVGCGDGAFLAALQALDHVDAVGLDPNPAVVRACRARGLNAIAGTFATLKPELPEGIDAFTMWHVVEHVADPVALLLEAKALLRAGGMICFSVPLSPLSWEHARADPLNAPPHHLTRWTLRALQALADRVGMKAQFEMPAADGFFARLTRSLALRAYPPFERRTRARKAARLAAFVLRRPWLLLSEVRAQRRLPRLAGRVRPDQVLVCLS